MKKKSYDTRNLYEDVQEGPSKSALKRQSDELQALGESLIELPEEELAALDMPEKLRDAIEVARRITAHGGLYRQKQFIGKLMRKIDVEPIRIALEAKRQKHRTDVLKFRRVEQWRDRLLADADSVSQFLQEYPDADAAQLNRLCAQARHEQTHQKTPAAARELFALLRTVMQS